MSTSDMLRHTRRNTLRFAIRMLRGSVAAGTLALAGACAVSTQQEVELGQNYSAQINKQLKLMKDAEIVRYINLLGDSIARVADDRSLDWSFFVVDSREVNAFAVPGGFVYVNRGLIERTTKMDQLAGVLAHEIGHVTQRHSVKQMQAAQRANAGLTLACILTNVCESQMAGAAVQIGGGLAFAAFSRGDEAESDKVAVQYLLRARIDPRGIPEMFRILLKERESRPSGPDAWFRTHPLEEDRVQATEAEIARIPPAQLRGLSTDSERFQQFRRRVAAG
ncbi:MAG: M48 family metalloprotease [Gemmatimonadaceae bacterium]|nr:M48 family metalloprotease [Gemmatimonadaceae bacterium]